MAGEAKVMLAPPRLNLRRAASYNRELDRLSVPLSATSSRFNFNHLFFPPPSPSLPALVNRPRRSPSQIIVSRPSRVLRFLFLVAVLIATVGLFGRHIWSHDLHHHRPSKDSPLRGSNIFTNDDSSDDNSHAGFKMVGQDALPDFPTPFVTSHGRRTRWTVSIPPNRDFPLSIDEYEGMGSRCREVAAHARELAGQTTQSESDRIVNDPLYMDVSQAEKAGLLVHTPGRAPVLNRAKKTGSFVGLSWEAMAGLPVCKSSLTYVLESPDAGLGTAVMNTWMLYGLAKQQNRAFFIDDSRWAYGAYIDIFQAPPVPDCRPPPRHHMAPCPAQANHLVVSSVTLRDVLPGLMAEYWKAVGSRGSLGFGGLGDLVGGGNGGDLHDLFELARQGHDALFKLNPEDAKYVAYRVQQLQDKAKQPGGGPVIGIHIRHGDQHPLEFQYRETYIPSDVFLDKAHYLAEVYLNRTAAAKRGTSLPDKESGKGIAVDMDIHMSRDLGKDGKVNGNGKRQTAETVSELEPWAQAQAFTVVASDDPAIFHQREFASSVRAQERILLSVKETIPEEDKKKQNPLVLHYFTEEEFGWEGGFFAPMFWNLGVDRKNNAGPRGDHASGGPAALRRREPPGEMTLKLRSLMGRAYAMDLAVLAGASEHVVCGVNAMGCRMLGVMLGWEGVRDGRWVNVDGDYEWGWING